MVPDDGVPAAESAGLDALAAAARAADAAPSAAPGAAAGVEGPQAAPALDARMSRETAEALARLGLDWIADALTKQYPVLNYPEATRAEGARLAGAVLAKYDVMRWAARWREEFELGAFLAGVAWKGYQLVKAGPPPSEPAASSPPGAG